MDALDFIGILVILMFLFFIWTLYTKHKPITITLLGLTFFIFVVVITTWIEKSGEENLLYQYETIIPFDYNKSNREYYIFHENEFKSAVNFVDGFSENYLNDPEYDSCYVYSVKTPIFLGFLTNKKWHPDYVYRQSEDIRLQLQEINTVEIK